MREWICRIALLLATLLISSCEQDSASVVGTWELQDPGNGLFRFDHSAFLPDGRKCVVSYVYENADLSLEAYLNTWRVEDGVIVTIYGPNTNPYTSEGDVMLDRIEKLDSKNLAVIMEQQPPSDVMEEFIRIDTNPERVCKLAEVIVKNGGIGIWSE